VSSGEPAIFKMDDLSSSPAHSAFELQQRSAAAHHSSGSALTGPSQPISATALQLLSQSQPSAIATAPAPSSSSLQRLHLEEEGDPTEDSSASGRIDCHLSKLPFSLVLLTFHSDHLPHCTHAILRALMPVNSLTDESAPASSLAAAASPTALRPGFFSFTQAGSEVSLIIEQSTVSSFPAACVTQHRSIWRAIQVSQGSEAEGEAGASLVAPLSAVLAQHGVSILYVSTSQFDYILVAEQQLEEAIQTLTKEMHVTVEDS
jgi:hypothetical protein